MAEQMKRFDSRFFHINCHSVHGVLKNCQLNHETLLSKTTFGIGIDSLSRFIRKLSYIGQTALLGRWVEVKGIAAAV
jgi:hypothetical protein